MGKGVDNFLAYFMQGQAWRGRDLPTLWAIILTAHDYRVAIGTRLGRRNRSVHNEFINFSEIRLGR
jgi:hypothetical protein